MENREIIKYLKVVLLAQGQEKFEPLLDQLEKEIDIFENLKNLNFSGRKKFEDKFYEWNRKYPSVEMTPANVLCYLQIELKGGVDNEEKTDNK